MLLTAAPRNFAHLQHKTSPLSQAGTKQQDVPYLGGALSLRSYPNKATYSSHSFSNVIPFVEPVILRSMPS